MTNIFYSQFALFAHDLHVCKFTCYPLHSRALAHSRAPLFTQACPHCSQSHAPGEHWARLCVFMLQGCVQAAQLCRGWTVKLWNTARWQEPAFDKASDLKSDPPLIVVWNAPESSPRKYQLVDGQICTGLKPHSATKYSVDSLALGHGMHNSECQ